MLHNYTTWGLSAIGSDFYTRLLGANSSSHLDSSRVLILCPTSQNNTAVGDSDKCTVI